MDAPAGPAATFARDGFLAVERLFDPALIDAARAEYERQYPDLSTDPAPPHLKVGHRRLQLAIDLRASLADPMLSAHPLLLGIVESLVGPGPEIDTLTCVVALPGARAQHFHRDHPPLFDEDAAIESALPPFAVTVSIPLIDLDEETGATLLFAGSHRSAERPDEEGADAGAARPAYMRRGGCYMMDYRLWHRGMANRSDRARPVLYFVFARPWFRDSHNFGAHPRVRVGEDVLRAMPDRQRRLFRRLAAKGMHDLTEAELLGEAPAAPPA